MPLIRCNRCNVTIIRLILKYVVRIPSEVSQAVAAAVQPDGGGGKSGLHRAG